MGYAQRRGRHPPHHPVGIRRVFRFVWDGLTDDGKFAVTVVGMLMGINIIARLLAFYFEGGVLINEGVTATQTAVSAWKIALKEGTCIWLPYIFSGMPSLLHGWVPTLAPPPHFWGMGVCGLVLMLDRGLSWFKERTIGLMVGYDIWAFFIIISWHRLPNMDQILPWGWYVVPFVGGMLFYLFEMINDQRD